MRATARRAPGRATRAALAGVAAAGALLLWLVWPARPPAPAPAPQRAVEPGPEPAPTPAEAPVAASPPSTAPPPVPGGEPEAAADAAPATPFLTEEGEPTRALVRGALAAAIERHDPSLKLSSDELEAATDALWTLREARLELARLGDDPAHARRRRELVEQIGQATADFTYYVEMSPGELTALDASGAGLSAPPPTVERAPAPAVQR